MTMTTPTIAFDSTAAFTPPTSLNPNTQPSSVVITGSATNAPNIANIAIYDGSTEIGSVSAFSSTYGWSDMVNLAPGTHNLTAVATSLTGVTFAAAAPYQLVMGVNNGPYTYQERDIDAFGKVVRVSSFDAQGALVSRTSLVDNGTASAPLSLAFDPTAVFESATGAHLSGTTTAYSSGASIKVFDGAAGGVLDPTSNSIYSSAKALGYATVNPDGTWTFDAHVGPGQHAFTAVAVGLNGVPVAAQSPFSLVTGVVGQPYVYQETDHTSDGRVAAITSYAAGGTVVGRANAGGPTVNGGISTAQVIRSAYDDVMTGDGTGSTTFQFRPGFGRDEITNFNYLSAAQSPAGIEHDVISLPPSALGTLVQVMRHTTTSLDGDAVIHLSRTDSIKLDGVTKADLVTHPDVFRFHS